MFPVVLYYQEYFRVHGENGDRGFAAVVWLIWPISVIFFIGMIIVFRMITIIDHAVRADKNKSLLAKIYHGTVNGCERYAKFVGNIINRLCNWAEPVERDWGDDHPDLEDD